MNQVSAVKRIKITLLLSIAFIVTLSYVASNETTEAVSSKAGKAGKAGLASDISIGHAQDNGRPQLAQAQAQSQTQKKTKVNQRSIGCVVCHTGSESMHMDG